MKARNGLLGAAAALLATTASGEELQLLAQLDEDPFFKELPVVLSVSRLAQPLHDAPGSVTVIDADAIRTSGARDLADLLRLVPGFLVAHANGGAPYAVYHGMTNENPRGLQVLVDGRSQYSPLFFGGIAWNLIDVPLDEIDRIEVLRGSNSAAYGSNAFLGVVNVITRSAAETQGVRVRIGAGNDGVQDRHARVGARVGDAAFRLSAETSRDNGIQHLDDSRFNRRVALRGDIPLNGVDEIQVQAGTVELGLRAGAQTNPGNPPRGQQAAKEYASLAWVRNSPEGGGISMRYTRTSERFRDDYYVSHPDMDRLAASLRLPVPYLVRIDQSIHTTRDELEFQHTVTPAQKARFVWGAGVRHDAVRGEEFYGRDGDWVRQSVHRLFGNFEWRPTEAWTTNLGMTWENDSLSDTSLAPRVAVNYHVSPRQTLRAGWSQAHRIPSLTEAKSREAYGRFDTGLVRMPFGVLPIDIVRNATGDLEKESIEVFEAGYLGEFPDQGLFVDMRAFQEKVKDRILLVSRDLVRPDCEAFAIIPSRGARCGRASDYVNGQDLTIEGVEYQVKWKPRQGTELALGQSFVSIDSRVDRSARLDAREIEKTEAHMDASAPRRATTLRWVQQLPAGTQLSVAHYRYSEFQWTLHTKVEPFNRTDVRLAHAFRVGPTRGELALTVQGVEGTRAEFRSGDADGDPGTMPYELVPRGWVSLSLEF